MSKRLMLNGAGDRFVISHSLASASHAGTFDVTAKISVQEPGAEVWQCPQFGWAGSDASLSTEDGYRLDLMPIGLSLKKGGAVLDEYWGAGWPSADQDEHTLRVREVPAGWEVYVDDVLTVTFADASKRTSGYVHFNVLSCKGTVDSISGTVNEDFESLAPQALGTGGVTLNNWYYRGGTGVTGAIESDTTFYQLDVLPRAFTVTGKSISMEWVPAPGAVSTKRWLQTSTGRMTISRHTSLVDAPGNFSLSCRLRYISTAGEAWQGPNILWHSNAEPFDGGTGYRLEFMTIGLQLWKDGAVIGDHWSQGLAADGIERLIRIIEVPTGWEVWIGNTRVINAADATKKTGGYVYFTTLDSSASIDEVSGTVAENFEALTLGAVSENSTVGNWRFVEGDAVEIEATGYEPTIYTLEVDKATYTTSRKQVGLHFHRQLSVSKATVAISRKSMGLQFHRVLNVAKRTYLVSGKPVAMELVPASSFEPLSILPARYSVTGGAVGMELVPAGSFDPLTVVPASLLVRTYPIAMTYIKRGEGGFGDGGIVINRRRRGR